MKKTRVARIYMRLEKGAWSWSFHNSVGGGFGGYTVKSNAATTIASYAITQATRIAKRTGFDDAKVVHIAIIEKDRTK